MADDKVSGSSFDDAVRQGRPDGDELRRDHARASLAAALFGEVAEPVRLGRFVLLDRIGQGGMGAVYSAYDPQLDRRVALKLLHPHVAGGSDEQRRLLLREARAAARLSHPSVVAVHDVGVIDDTVFLVMEHVAGVTLRAWLAAAPRSWRDVVDAYTEAGRGLAAAHEAGVVHRDFKPDNALIGDDGRVRVVDFGIARQRGIDPTSPAATASPASATSASPDAGADPAERSPAGSAAAGSGRPLPLATTVRPPAIAGTPHYMAPEQLAGEPAGPAADQFAFCVALYEGLHGQRPFAGETLGELHEAAREGRIREPPRDRRVPRRLHAAVCRGLASRPEDRHRSMAALLAALSLEPRRVHAGVVALGAAAACAVALGVVGIRDEPAATCDGGAADLAAVWNQTRGGRVDRALRATGRAFAAEVAPRIRTSLDRHGRGWVDMRRDACVRHRDGLQSAVLLDQRMRCLDSWLRDMDAAVAVLEQVDVSSLDRALNVVEGLPALAACADSDALAAEVSPPRSAAVAARVGELRARLSRARALEVAGRYDQAQRMADELVREAEATGYRPVLAEGLLAAGRSRMMVQDAAFDQAAGPLRRAAEIAVEQRMWPVAVEALARWFYVEGGRGERGAGPAALMPMAEALAAHVVSDPLARPLLLNNIGIVHMRGGDRERAHHYFERALHELDRTPAAPLELTSVRRNLAMLSPDPARREALMQQELERLDGRLGASHPWTLGLRLAYAHYTADPARARELLAPACALYERFHAEQVRPYAACLYYLGFLTERLGDREHAADILTRAADLARSGVAVDEPGWEALAHGYALHYRGRHAEALAAFRAVSERLAKASSTEWWVKQRAAHAGLGAGLCLGAMGRKRDAFRELEAAAGAFEQLRTINQDADHEQRLAVARAALASL